MGSIGSNLQEVKRRIVTACFAAGRDANGVTLLAVSKTFGADAVRAAFAAGQRAFGENYVQEALSKMEALGDLRAQLEWHLIGPLQSNKTRAVAESFDWVHTIDRPKTARRLSQQRPESLGNLNVCIQVNVDDEAAKSGVACDGVLQLAREIVTLPRLVLRGLMCLPAIRANFEEQRVPFARLREIAEMLRREGLDIDTLSMGMTDDYRAAVFEGATIVRIGTALFGPRETGVNERLTT